MGGGISSCSGNGDVKWGQMKLIYGDMNNSYGWSMSYFLPKKEFLETKPAKRNQRKLWKAILKTPGNVKCGNLLEIGLEYPSKINEKTKHCHFLQRKTVKLEDF